MPTSRYTSAILFLAAVVFIKWVSAPIYGCSWCDEHLPPGKISISSSVASARSEALKVHRSTSPESVLCPAAEDYFFRILEQNDAATETLYFEFEQTADYGNNFTSKIYGKVFYQSPENVRLDFYPSADFSVKSQPPSRTIVIDGKKFYDYNSATNQCVIADWNKIKAGGDESDFFMSFRSENIRKLKDKYDVKLVELSSSSAVRLSVFMEGVKSGHHPDLSGSDPGVIMNMDFDLSPGDGSGNFSVIPLRTDFISGSVRFTTTVKNFKRNPPLPEKDYFKKYRPPRGAEIIK